MGQKEWGIFIRSTEDINKIKDLISDYNNLSDDSVRNSLSASAIIQCNIDKNYYLCVISSTNEENITDYILSNYVGTVYLPCAKPTWWHKQHKYTSIWRAKVPNDPIISPWQTNQVNQAIRL